METNSITNEELLERLQGLLTNLKNDLYDVDIALNNVVDKAVSGLTSSIVDDLTDVLYSINDINFILDENIEQIGAELINKDN
jgi:hypothetical protein